MKSDIPIKRILQVRPEDWISFLFPALDEITLTDMPTDMVPKSESRMDNVKNVNNEFVSHIEPNGYLDSTLPGRMLRYRADIWEYTLRRNKETPPISQTVILFFEKHDNKLHSLRDNRFEDQALDYRYKVVKVWEIDVNEILERKLIGLYPLLPLARHEKDENEELILSDAIQAIQTVEDDGLKSDLLSAMSILAGEKYSKEFVKKYVRREQLMESALFQEWVAEFVDEAEEKAEERKALDVAKELLKRKMQLSDISEITKLPIEKIKKLQALH